MEAVVGAVALILLFVLITLILRLWERRIEAEQQQRLLDLARWHRRKDKP